ncbi:MAG TPA: ATP-binding protein [Streptomyces sp.]
MPTLVHRFVLAGGEREVSLARRKVVDKVCTWGVSLDDETADAIRLIASELIANAVVHGEGPVTVALYHRSGRLVIDVLDGNPVAPQTSCAQADDENGRGLTKARGRRRSRVRDPGGCLMGRKSPRTTPLPDPDVVFRPVRHDVEVTWVGPGRSSGMHAALCACRACLYELDQRVLETSTRHDTGVSPMNGGSARSHR